MFLTSAGSWRTARRLVNQPTLSIRSSLIAYAALLTVCWSSLGLGSCAEVELEGWLPLSGRVYALTSAATEPALDLTPVQRVTRMLAKGCFYGSAPITYFTLATTTQIELEKPPSKVVHFHSTQSGAL